MGVCSTGVPADIGSGTLRKTRYPGPRIEFWVLSRKSLGTPPLDRACRKTFGTGCPYAWMGLCECRQGWGGLGRLKSDVLCVKVLI